MVELLRQSGYKVQKLFQENSYFAHPENIVISFLSDTRDEVRRCGVLFILEAREKFNPEKHPRQFLSPKNNFDTLSYEEGVRFMPGDEHENPSKGINFIQ